MSLNDLPDEERERMHEDVLYRLAYGTYGGRTPWGMEHAADLVKSIETMAVDRARVVGGTDGPDQGDLARLLAASWAVAEPSHGVTLHPVSYVATWVDVARALVDAGWRPGAVAAAPPGDEDEATRAVLDLTYRAQDVHELSPGAEAVYRYLDAGWRLVPPAPPAGHEDVAAAPPGDEDAETWGGGCECRVTPESEWFYYGSAVEPGSQTEFNPDCPKHGTPHAGYEDEAVVERAARAAYAAFNGQEMPAHSTRMGHWRSVVRAALAAARGPRTPDPGAGA